MVITVEQMSRSEVQKIKLLELYNFLRRETDENNPLSTAEIIEGLKPDGIAVERKALINDIKVLNEWDYVVNPLALVLNDNNYYLVCYNRLTKPVFLLYFLINLLEPEFTTRTFIRIVF